jgi:hypothetical protein
MLVITTLPHYIAILLHRPNPDYTYMRLIFLATTLSVAYHLTDESNLLITALDYLVAAALAYHETKIHKHGLVLNGLLFVTNIIPLKKESYTLYHSIWHLASVAKTIYISNTKIKTLGQDEISEDQRTTVL